MPNNRYLTPILKQYYEDAYFKARNYPIEKFKTYSEEKLEGYSIKDLEFFRLDRKLIPYLDEIVKSSSIRPVFSAFYTKKSIRPVNKSYLWFAYDEAIESLLMEEILPPIKDRFNTKAKYSSLAREAECDFDQMPPVVLSPEKRKRAEALPSIVSDIKYMSDPDYKNITRIYVEITTIKESLHEDFWKALTDALKGL